MRFWVWSFDPVIDSKRLGVAELNRMNTQSFRAPRVENFQIARNSSCTVTTVEAGVTFKRVVSRAILALSS